VKLTPFLFTVKPEAVPIVGATADPVSNPQSQIQHRQEIRSGNCTELGHFDPLWANFRRDM